MLSSKFYEGQIDRFKKQEVQVGRKSKLLATVRVVLFLTWLVGFLMLVNYREMQWALVVSAVFISAFTAVVKIHNKVKFNRRQLQNLIQINEAELARQKGNYTGLYDVGGY